ncbi:Hint domain-containing protein [Rhodosalinus sp. 5P4]|uniref:Hint domain-containing protein n=1 Tax=Rhodosalinus sp. 5P4 TaxID=3239196 RepID=UPI003525CBB2
MRPRQPRRVSDAGLDLCQPPGTGGIPAGAIVYSKDGELPVEYLCPGDRIITRDRGLATLRAVTWRRARMRRIRFPARVMGQLRPIRDTALPGCQGVLIRDWRAKALYGAEQAIIPAARLVDGTCVTDEGVAEWTLFTLKFDSPHIVYADGLELAAASAMTAAAES